MVAIRITITDDMPPAGMKRAHNRAMKKTYEGVGMRWASDFLPLHTEPGAESRYGYAPRAAATIAKKERLAKHGYVPVPVRPMVDRGRLHDEIRKPVIVRGFPTRAQVRVRTPVDKRTGRAYVTIKPRKATAVNLYKELGTVIPAEKRVLEDEARKTYETEIVAQTKSRGRPRKTIS